MKIKTKTWLAKVAVIFNHGTSHLRRISVLGFFNSKMKKCIFLVSIVLLVFWVLVFFWCSFGVVLLVFLYVWTTYLFCIIKNNRNNVWCATNHTMFFLFKTNSPRMSLLQWSVSYILTENSLREGKILDNKNFNKLLINIYIYIYIYISRICKLCGNKMKEINGGKPGMGKINIFWLKTCCYTFFHKKQVICWKKLWLLFSSAN